MRKRKPKGRRSSKPPGPPSPRPGRDDAASPAVRHPWERQPAESVHAYRAFIVYRDLGADRSLERAAAGCRKHVSLMRRWSVQYSWPERAAAWEDGLQRDADEAARRDQEASLQQKVKDAKQFQRLGRALIAAGIKQDPDTGQIASLERAMVREGESLYTMGCELEERLAGVGSASGGLDRQARSLKRMSRRQVKALRDQLAERLAEVDAKLTGVDQRLLDTLERAEKILEKWPIEAVEDLAFQEPPPDISGGEIKL